MTTPTNSRRVEQVHKRIDDLENLSHAEKKELFRLIVDHVDEARHNDSEFTDHFYYKLKARFENEAAFRPQVEAYVESKLRYLLGFVGLAGLVVSLFGVFGIDKFAGSTAQKVAQEIADKFSDANAVNFAALRQEVRQEVSLATKDAREAAISTQAKIDQEISSLGKDTREYVDKAVETKSNLAAEKYALQANRFQEDAKRARDEIDRDVASARAEMAAQFMRFQERLDQELTAASEKLEAMVKGSEERFKKTGETLAASIRAETENELKKQFEEQRILFDNETKTLKDDIRRTIEEGLRKLLEASGKEQENIRRTGDANKIPTQGELGKVSSPSDSSKSSRPPAEEPDGEIDLESPYFNLLLESLELHVNRRFGFSALLSVAKKAADVQQFDTARSALGPILDMPELQPGGYTARDRAEVSDILLHPDVPRKNRLDNATECMMSAARARDKDMFQKAVESRRTNILSRAASRNVFLEVAQAFMDDKPADEIVALMRQVDADSLLTRGYLNLLAIAKRIRGVQMDFVAERQKQLLDKVIGSSFIDRPSDYTTAYFLLDTLNREPFVRDERLGEVCMVVEREVFRDDSKEDPWKLRELIAGVREKLTPAPPAQSQTGDQSGQVPADQRRSEEARPERQDQ